jgi:hypothetical protein
MNCHFGTQMCPPFARCNTTQRNDAGMPTSGLCVRNVTDGASDATVDAVVDAPAEAGAPDAGASDASVDTRG